MFQIRERGSTVARELRGGILLWVLATTVLAAIVEAITPAGPSAAPTRRAGASPPRPCRTGS